MSGEERVDPAALRNLATQLSDVTDLLSGAQTTIINSEIDPASFSPSGTFLAYSFLGAIEFAGNDAFEQADQIGSIQYRLHRTADIWEAADEESTVQEC